MKCHLDIDYRSPTPHLHKTCSSARVCLRHGRVKILILLLRFEKNNERHSRPAPRNYVPRTAADQHANLRFIQHIISASAAGSGLCSPAFPKLKAMSTMSNGFSFFCPLYFIVIVILVPYHCPQQYSVPATATHCLPYIVHWYLLRWFFGNPLRATRRLRSLVVVVVVISYLSVVHCTETKCYKMYLTNEQRVDVTHKHTGHQVYDECARTFIYKFINNLMYVSATRCGQTSSRRQQYKWGFWSRDVTGLHGPS